MAIAKPDKEFLENEDSQVVINPNKDPLHNFDETDEGTTILYDENDELNPENETSSESSQPVDNTGGDSYDEIEEETEATTVLEYEDDETEEATTILEEEEPEEEFIEEEATTILEDPDDVEPEEDFIPEEATTILEDPDEEHAGSNDQPVYETEPQTEDVEDDFIPEEATTILEDPDEVEPEEEYLEEEATTILEDPDEEVVTLDNQDADEVPLEWGTNPHDVPVSGHHEDAGNKQVVVPQVNEDLEEDFIPEVELKAKPRKEVMEELGSKQPVVEAVQDKGETDTNLQEVDSMNGRRPEHQQVLKVPDTSNAPLDYEEDIDDEEDYISVDATTILEFDDDEEMGEYQAPTTSTLKGSEALDTGAVHTSTMEDRKYQQPRPMQQPQVEPDYQSPEFKNQSGQGMFSEEERLRLEQQRQQQEEQVKQRAKLQGSNVSSKLANKLKRDPNEVKLNVYDDSATAALYYSGYAENTGAEQQFMQELEQGSRYGGQPIEEEEITETQAIRDGYDQIDNAQTSKPYMRHKPRPTQQPNQKGGKGKGKAKGGKGVGVNTDIVLKVAIVGVLLALAYYLFM